MWKASECRCFEPYSVIVRRLAVVLSSLTADRDEEHALVLACNKRIQAAKNVEISTRTGEMVHSGLRAIFNAGSIRQIFILVTIHAVKKSCHFRPSETEKYVLTLPRGVRCEKTEQPRISRLWSQLLPQLCSRAGTAIAAPQWTKYLTC